MQFSGEISQIIGWRLPTEVGANLWEILDPPLGDMCHTKFPSETHWYIHFCTQNILLKHISKNCFVSDMTDSDSILARSLILTDMSLTKPICSKSAERFYSMCRSLSYQRYLVQIKIGFRYCPS